MPDPIRSLDPRLEAGLASVRGRVKRVAATHGLGTWIASAAVLFVGSFYLDRFLNPPLAMRLVVAPIVWISLLAGFIWWVVRRARVRVTREDAALLVERNYPELKERLITAVQLARDAGGRSGAGEWRDRGGRGGGARGRFPACGARRGRACGRSPVSLGSRARGSSRCANRATRPFSSSDCWECPSSSRSAPTSTSTSPPARPT